jgi:branched-chain amino acid transport system ATP-binding protein
MTEGLVVKGLSISHGAVSAIHNLSFDIAPGELVALIGANGAGKTTLLRALSGLIAPQSGTATWHGTSIVKTKPEDLVRAGIVHVSEGKSVIPELTVRENLAIGGLWRRDKKDVLRATAESLELFPVLNERISQRADSLSGGERQMLAIARALISRPELLLLDEPSLGLAPLIVEQIFESLNTLRVHVGMTILLVEQNALGALKIADRGLILNLGNLVGSGPAKELLHDPQLRSAYLGF